MYGYYFRVGQPANPYIFRVKECDEGAGWVAVEVVVQGAADGSKQGVGDDMEAAVLDAIEGLLPTQASDPKFIEEVREQFLLQLVSIPV